MGVENELREAIGSPAGSISEDISQRTACIYEYVHLILRGVTMLEPWGLSLYISYSHLELWVTVQQQDRLVHEIALEPM